jgi:DNA-binding transcriptional ArsR family regulator
MPAVSRHLKVLERAALISRSRSGKWRASHLEAAPLREAADWIERYRTVAADHREVQAWQS